MGEEAFDETVLVAGTGNGNGNGKAKLLYVRGGYCRDDVYIGIGEIGSHDPDVVVHVDGAELKRALRSMQIGEPRRRKGADK